MKWLLRGAPQSPVDTGWQLLSATDTTEWLAVPGNLLVIDWAQAVQILPALGGVGNLPVGTSLSVEPGANGHRLLDTRTGAEITEAEVAAAVAALHTPQMPQAAYAPSQVAQAFHPHGAYPAPPRRRTGMFTTGLVLTIIGGLFVMGKLRRVALGQTTSHAGESPAFVAGTVTADLLLTVVPIVVGVILLARSRGRR